MATATATQPQKQTASPQPPKPGIYEDVSFEEYLAWQAVNNSLLKHGTRSMAHVKAAMDGPPKEPTPAMQLGTLMHGGILEPLAIVKRYVVMPPFEREITKDDGTPYAKPKATKQYKLLVQDFRDEHPDQEIVTEDQYQALLGVSNALSENDRARQWLNAPGKPEVSIVWNDPATGIRCKARLDKWTPNGPQAGLTDLKTTADALRFESQIAKLGYHRQLAMYCDGLRVLTGTNYEPRLIAVEPTAPYGVRAAVLSDDALNWGRESYRELLARYAECLARDAWPGYEDPDYWHLPNWATADAVNADVVELAIGGEPVAM